MTTSNVDVLAGDWRAAAAAEPEARMDTLTRLVGLAVGLDAIEWAAGVVAGVSTAALRRAFPDRFERLAAELLDHADLPAIHAVLLADLRATHWFDAGDLDQAIAHHRTAVERARAVEQPRILCHALNNLGNAVAVADGAAAEACFGEAIELARQHGAVDEELISLNNLCVTRMDAGELDSAGEAFDFAIRRVDETGRWKTFGNVIVGNLGTLYARSGNRTLATTFLRRAMEVAAAAGDTELASAWSDQLAAGAS
jgi:tetratricopeptide (TPR) repeat protein